MSATAKKETHVKVLGINALKLSEFDKPQYVAKIDDLSTTPDDVMKPEFWVNESKKLAIDIRGRCPAQVELFWADYSHYMRVFVVAAGNNFAKVVCVESTALLDKPVAEVVKTEIAKAPTVKNPSACGEYEFKWVNVGEKFSIVRLSDEKVIETNVFSKEAAQEWLNEYLKAL